MSDLARLNHLFDEGVEVPFPDGTLYWLSKLNPFEADEARKDGMAARSLTILAIREQGTSDYAVFQAGLDGVQAPQLIEQIVSSRELEIFSKAIRETNADPEWVERVAILTRLLEVTPADGSPELEQAKKIDGDYNDELFKRGREARAVMERELAEQSLDSLKDLFREVYVERQASDSFSREYRITEIFFGLRRCQASSAVEGVKERHKGCTHDRALDSRDEVKMLSEPVLEVVSRAIASLTMSRDDARFSDAPSTSSESSGQPVAQEASTPSTPEVTSPVPAGI